MLCSYKYILCVFQILTFPKVLPSVLKELFYLSHFPGGLYLVTVVYFSILNYLTETNNLYLFFLIFNISNGKHYSLFQNINSSATGLYKAIETKMFISATFLTSVMMVQAATSSKKIALASGSGAT